MIIHSESEHFYIAMPKGPVCDDHFLLVPKRHIAHTLELTDEVEEEFEMLRDFLLDYIMNVKHMDYLMFERNSPFKFEKAAHMNIQILALPSDVNLEERVRKLLNTFQSQNTNERQNAFAEITERESDLRAELGNDPSKHFFYLQIPGLRTARGRQRIRFYQHLLPGAPFDIQFGRILACHLLGQRNKLNWKNCVLPKDQE